MRRTLHKGQRKWEQRGHSCLTALCCRRHRRNAHNKSWAKHNSTGIETSQKTALSNRTVHFNFCTCLDSLAPSAIEQLSITARLANSDPQVARMVASLKRSGKCVWILSGDNEITDRVVGRELGFDPSNIKAGVLPQERSAFIQELKERVVIKSRR